MFDFSWPEMAIIAVVALVVIGPKDLPRVLRTAGQWVRRARSIAREFQGNLEQMVREAELEDVKEQLKKTASFDLENEIAKTVDPDGSLKSSLADKHGMMSAVAPLLADPTTPEATPPDAVLPDSAIPAADMPAAEPTAAEPPAAEPPAAEPPAGEPPAGEPHAVEQSGTDEPDRHARTGS